MFCSQFLPLCFLSEPYLNQIFLKMRLVILRSPELAALSLPLPVKPTLLAKHLKRRAIVTHCHNSVLFCAF